MPPHFTASAADGLIRVGRSRGVTPRHCNQLRADRKGEFAVSLWASYRLIFQPDHDPLPTLDDGGIDKTKVTQIEIKEVVDYHGN